MRTRLRTDLAFYGDDLRPQALAGVQPRCRSALPRRLVAMVERRMDLHTDQPFALASDARAISRYPL